jgi:hypothetical protein
VDFINLLHNPLGPLNAGINQFVRSRAALRSAEQVVCCLHVRLARIAAMIPITRFRPSSIPASYNVRRVFAKGYTVRVGLISRLFPFIGEFGGQGGGVRVKEQTTQRRWRKQPPKNDG